MKQILHHSTLGSERGEEVGKESGTPLQNTGHGQSGSRKGRRYRDQRRIFLSSFSFSASDSPFLCCFLSFFLSSVFQGLPMSLGLLETSILSTYPPEWWDYRHAPLCLLRSYFSAHEKSVINDVRDWMTTDWNSRDHEPKWNLFPCEWSISGSLLPW